LYGWPPIADWNDDAVIAAFGISSSLCTPTDTATLLVWFTTGDDPDAHAVQFDAPDDAENVPTGHGVGFHEPATAE
jgi:hypothetical protein